VFQLVHPLHYCADPIADELLHSTTHSTVEPLHSVADSAAEPLQSVADSTAAGAAPTVTSLII
jgi:hypothetical protein